MYLPQTVVSYSYIHHAEETTRTTLSDKHNTFKTFINVKHKLISEN